LPRRFSARFGTAGQTLRYRVQIRNLTAKTQAGLTLLEDLADSRRRFRNGWRFNWPKAGASAPSASPNDAGKIPSAWPLSKRRKCRRCPRGARRRRGWKSSVAPGILRFTGVTLARPDPLDCSVRSAKLPRRRAS